MNASALIEPARARNSLVNWAWRGRRVALAALSPLYMGYLFYGQATGRITPDALKQRRERYGYGVDPVYTKCKYDPARFLLLAIENAHMPLRPCDSPTGRC